MDLLHLSWQQAGAFGVLVAMLAFGNWLQWKRAATKDEQLLAITKEVGTVAAQAAAAADKQAAALDRNTTAFQELSLWVAGRGASR